MASLKEVVKRMDSKKKYLKSALAPRAAQAAFGVLSVRAQTATDVPDVLRPRANQASVAEFFDPSAGMTADEAVARALAANGELLALRKEVEAGRALGEQAGE